MAAPIFSASASTSPIEARDVVTTPGAGTTGHTDFIHVDFTALTDTPRPRALDPATILDRLDVEDALQFVRHARDEHTNGAVYTLAECPRCYMHVLSWLAAGIVDIDDLLTHSAAATPPAGAPVDVTVHRDGVPIYRTEGTVTTGPAPAGDVLDVVDTDGHILCACGCRTRITDHSPSAYFATQDCSEQWHYLQFEKTAPPAAPRPARPRPARPPRPVGPTGTEPALTWTSLVSPYIAEQISVTYREDATDLTVSTFLAPAFIYTDITLDPLLYTRPCPSCGTDAIPSTEHGPGPASTIVTLDDVHQLCHSCAAVLPGPARFGWIERLDTMARLHLEGGGATVATEMTLTAGYRRGLPRPTQLAAARARRLWTRLETDLTDFLTTWSPPTAAAAPGDDVPYLIDNPATPAARPVPPWRRC